MELVRKQLNGYRVLQSQVQYYEQQTDLIIPDVNPDALTVVGVWGNCVVGEQALRRDKVTVGGTVPFTLLYRPENGGNTISVKGSLNFQEVLELKDAIEDDLLFVHAEIGEMRAVILNSRKIGVQCRVLLFAWAYQRESVLITEGVQSKPEEGLQLRTKTFSVQRMIAVYEKNLMINEEIRLNNMSVQDQLLHTILTWKTDDVRMLNKKVMVRGAVQVRLLMLEAGGNLRQQEYALPFSQILESNDIRTDCYAEVHYTTIQQQTRMERREEGVFLVCGLGAKAMMEVYRESQLHTVSDLYSTRYFTDVQCVPVPVRSSKYVLISGKMQATVPVDVRVRSVSHWHCCGASAEICGDKLRAVVHLSALWEDEEGCKYQQHITLREERETSGLCSGAICMMVQGGSVVGNGEGLTAEVQVQYRARQQCDGQNSQVDACELHESNPRTCYKPGTLLLRTVGEKECAWDLARCYGTTESAIRAANHLKADQNLEEKQRVLIPFLRQ